MSSDSSTKMPSLCRHIGQCLCCSFDDKHNEHNAIVNGQIHKTSTISADGLLFYFTVFVNKIGFIS